MRSSATGFVRHSTRTDAQMVPLHPDVAADRLGDWQIATPTGALRHPGVSASQVFGFSGRPPLWSTLQMRGCAGARRSSHARWASARGPHRQPLGALHRRRAFPNPSGPGAGRGAAHGARQRCRDPLSRRDLDHKDFSFEIDGAPAALGFSIAVDAFCLRLRFPDDLWSDLGDAGGSALPRDADRAFP